MVRLSGVDGHHFSVLLIDPHFFKLVKLADFGAEQMDDHIASIDQNPIAGFAAF